MTGSKYRSHNLHRTLRQRTHEGPSVWFRQDSIVENHDDAAIAFSANEAADSLTQFQDCFRQRVFSEGVATARFDIFQFRLDQGMIGNGERETPDYDSPQSDASDINAAPEAVDAKEDTARRAFEWVEQFRPQQPATWHQQI